MHTAKSVLTGFLLLFLAACQSVNPPRFQSMYNEFERTARQQLEQKLDPETLTPASANQQEDASQAVTSFYHAQHLALRHSKRIAAIFAELGIHQAEATQQQLLENPGLELSLMRPEDGGRWQMEFSLSLGLLDWLSRQQRIRLAETENLRWQAHAWKLLSDELSEVRQHWLDAVAAQQKLAIHRELYDSASVSEDFAMLLFEAGNISELELLSNQSVADQRQAQLIQAELDARQSLNLLQQSLGLEGQANLTVPEQFPTVADNQAVFADADLAALMELANQHQPALQLSRFEWQQSEDALALAMRRTTLRELGLELMTERESDGERQHGFAVSISPPLFDNGDTELSALQGSIQYRRIHYQQIEAETATAIRNSLQQMQGSLQQIDLLESHELPRFQRMMRLSVEEYNFMLRGTFELLTVADLMLDARLRHVDSTQQYWAAYSTLENLLGTQITETGHD